MGQSMINMLYWYCDIFLVIEQCKKLVFEYGPLILANSEKILEQTDICKAIHACPAKPLGDNAVSSVGTVPSLADAWTRAPDMMEGSTYMVYERKWVRKWHFVCVSLSVYESDMIQSLSMDGLCKHVHWYVGIYDWLLHCRVND